MFKLFDQAQVAGADGIDNQFDGKLQFVQPAFFRGHDDITQLFDRMRRSELNRFLDKGN
jgi:hypothetical protein